jgi:hypothetical protein
MATATALAGIFLEAVSSTLWAEWAALQRVCIGR